jgi:hypothetical protein
MIYLSNDYEDILARLGDGLPKAYGCQLLLKLYTRDEVSHQKNGEKGSIIIPDSVREEEIYQTIAGMVLEVGPACFGEDIFAGWTRPVLGDWVLFRPNSGIRFQYDGVPLRFVYDDCIVGRVKNPALLRR